MGRTTRVFCAIALLVGVAIWSVSAWVTKAAVGQLGAATLAERFPRPDEMFRPINFVPAPNAAALKAHRLADLADCATTEWPFLAPECFPPPRAAAPEPTITIERQVSDKESELVRVAVSAPVSAASGAACKQNLVAATARLERALAQIKVVKSSGGADRCSAYRRHFFEIVKAREVTARCTSGAARDRDLGSIDVAVENLNGTIAQTCGS